MAKEYSIRSETSGSRPEIEVILVCSTFDTDRGTFMRRDASMEEIAEQVDTWISEFDIPTIDKAKLVASLKRALTHPAKQNSFLGQ